MAGLAPFTTDRSWDFAVSPARLWELVSDTSAFPRWWPWLRVLEPVALEPGARTHCVIDPPLPYRLAVDLHLRDVVPVTRIDVDVSGDVRGPARLEIAPAGPERSTARLTWELEVSRPLLRGGARLARPVLQWGHDWVVGRGVEQFRRRAVGDGPAT